MCSSSWLQTKGLGQTESVDSDPCKWAVWLRKLGSAEIFLLKAPSPEVKGTWMKAIKECHERKRPGFLKGLKFTLWVFLKGCHTLNVP